MNIDTSIPSCSSYFLYVNVPFQFAFRHFVLAFASSQANPELTLWGRVKHFCFAIALTLPIINIIVAVAERCLYPPIETIPIEKQPPLQTQYPPIETISIEEQQLLQTQSITPQNKSEAVKQSLSGAERIEQALQTVIEKQKNNPFYRANAKRVEPPKDHTTKFCFRTPLAGAIEKGDLNELGRLLSENVEGLNNQIMEYLQVTDGRHRRDTPLIYSIRHKQFEVFKTLLALPASKIDINLNPDERGTALHEACKLGQDAGPFIEELINKNADPLIGADYKIGKICEQVSPLKIAKDCKVPKEYLEKLQAWTALNLPSKEAQKELHKAIQESQLETVKSVINAGICLEVRNKNGCTAFQAAVNSFIKSPSQSSKEIVLFLLNQGSFVNAEDKDGRTAFYLLCENQPEHWEELAKILIDCGADVERPDTYGHNTLSLIFTLPEDHVIKKYLLTKNQGKYQEHLNRRNIATLLGLKITTKVENKRVELKGGNQATTVYQILYQSLNSFIEQENEEKV